MKNLESLQTRLASFSQSHVLRFWDELSPSEQARLVSQLEEIDFEQLAKLIADEDEKPDFAALAAAAEAPPAVRVDGSGAGWTVEQAQQAGEAALAAGEVGAIVVAGGQGTRLGFEQPKGMFPVGPVSNRTLFQFFADRLLALAEKYGKSIPFYIMTSEATDAETRAYFEQNDYLGLSPDEVLIFRQGTMPAVDAATGQLLLASKSSLALSPDGHGGTVQALQRSGALDDAKHRGVRHLSYIQVDNPLVNLCDPALIGHHLMSQSELTTQVIRKRYPMEKVGNIAVAGGVVQVIEYSDLPVAAAEARDAKGELKLWAGSIGVHVIQIDFLCRISKQVGALPFHRASKKVPFVDAAGQLVEPSEPNATKFERFIFDLLPSAKNAFVVEVAAADGFAPVKNADGAENDTPKLAKEAIVSQHRRWLEAAGATVAEDVKVEINPRYALSSAQLAKKIPQNLKIEVDRYFDS
ncbi:UTP--glucose-1-phosphate uridylyltransferase [Novipirellula artificiosorum]|uniref:Putative uridylyltransferase n=1 Tax=Novipirellula artificiosorum TaxID=2528016 RepID=A0A5C6DJM0_9BACT|nr:UDPGP type 1 family protein [Novipirellula artificiosorum]TWU35106.1 putative uridylyltransferase [Novipirellula artificiosorum]